MIMQDGINNNSNYGFNSTYNIMSNMYYSNNDIAKSTILKWYNLNIDNNTSLSSNVVSGNYYCEEAKAKVTSYYTSGNTIMTVYNDYSPNFKCETDGNGKGLVNASVGLLSYDEVVYAGGYYGKSSNYYLTNGTIFWTMSPGGLSNNNTADVWAVHEDGLIRNRGAILKIKLRPVINVKSDVKASGTGTNSDPFVVE